MGGLPLRPPRVPGVGGAVLPSEDLLLALALAGTAILAVVGVQLVRMVVKVGLAALSVILGHACGAAPRY